MLQGRLLTRYPYEHRSRGRLSGTSYSGRNLPVTLKSALIRSDTVQCYRGDYLLVILVSVGVEAGFLVLLLLEGGTLELLFHYTTVTVLTHIGATSERSQGHHE